MSDAANFLHIVCENIPSIMTDNANLIHIVNENMQSTITYATNFLLTYILYAKIYCQL